MRSLVISACLVFVGGAALRAQAAPAPQQTALKWGPAPAVFPKGATMAVVSGDPSKAGPFAVQLAMPDGYKIAPHFHPTDERVTVQQGTLLLGMGDASDQSKMATMKAGETHSMAANAHHYATAKGATVISVSGMGPFGMTYVNPAEDPQRQSAKP
jgi:quercetin dioxygenase-like cupin family protein